MKKVFAALLLSFLPLRLHAFVGDPQVLPEKSIAVHFSTTIPVNTSSTTAPSIVVLVQLSSTNATTGAWPHQETGEIDVSHLRIDVDKAATSTETIKIGVVTWVGQSTGTVTFFYSDSNQRDVSNNEAGFLWNLSPAFWKCRVQGATSATVGTTPFIASNDTRSGSNLYYSTAVYNTSMGVNTTWLHPGDIVAEMSNLDATNPVLVNIEMLYHSEK